MAATDNKPACQSVNPYSGDARRKASQVRQMFDHIAPAYDRMNRLMTFGIDRLWRRRLVATLRGEAPASVLDVACGTGDLAILLAQSLGAAVTGLDLSEEMIRVGHAKVMRRGLAGKVRMEQGDCLHLPFQEGAFDCVTVAYGVRNFEDLLRGYSQMHKVLRPGGLLAVLELSTPVSPLVRPLYDFYAGRVIPLMGRLVAKDMTAYDYLRRSIAAVPQGEQMLEIMRAAGFTDARCRPMTLGVCSLYTARKAPAL